MIVILQLDILKNALNIYSRSLFSNNEIYIGFALRLENHNYLNVFTFNNLKRFYFKQSEDLVFKIPEKIYNSFFEKKESNFRISYSNEFSFLINNQLDEFYLKLYGLPSKEKNYGFLYIISKERFSFDDEKKKVFKKFISVFENNVDTIYFVKYSKYSINAFVKNYLTILRNHSRIIYEHSLRVSDLSSIIASLLNLDEESIFKLQIASLIHDIGYIWVSPKAISEYIENSEVENNLMEIHLNRLKEMFLGNVLMTPYVNIAINHHERLDGKGYFGKSNLSIEDNILIVSNYIDEQIVLTENEDIAFVVKDIEKKADSVFDKDIVNVAAEAIKIYYTEFHTESFSDLILKSKTLNLFYEAPGGEIIEFSGIIEKKFGDIIHINSKTFDEISKDSILKLKITTKDFPEYAKARVILKTPYGYVLKIIETKISKKSKLKVFWGFDFYIGFKNDITPLLKEKLTPVMKNILKSKFKRAKCKIFGAEGIIFTINNENDVFKVGDVVIFHITEFGESLYIPATLTEKNTGLHCNEYTSKFFELPERMQAAIYRLIFRRQASIRSIGSFHEEK